MLIFAKTAEKNIMKYFAVKEIIWKIEIQKMNFF